MVVNRRDMVPYPQILRLTAAALGGAVLLAGSVAAQSELSKVANPHVRVHYYSTAAPPEDFRGLTPDVSPSSDDPFFGLTAAESPGLIDEEPDPSPSEDSRNGGDNSSSSNSSDPENVIEPEPDRLADARAVDRVPPGGPDRVPVNQPLSAESDPIAYAKAELAACKRRFAEVRDYTCTFIKREQINGRLSGYEVMSMKARTNPRSVYFKFKQPKAGREAIYVHGRHQGKAIVHDVGIGKFLAGTVHLDPLSRRAMDGNRHPITEAGIGFLIDTLSEGWHREMNPQDSEVTIRDGVLVNKRPTTLIVCTHPKRNPHFVFHEVRLYIDQELGLPIRFEAYDWPRRSGEPAPLLEEYIYSDLRLNVGLTDHDFDPTNKAYSFGRF